MPASKILLAELIKDFMPKTKIIIYPPSHIKKDEKTNLEKLLLTLYIKSKNIFKKEFNYSQKLTNIKERKSKYKLKSKIPKNFYLIDDIYTSGSTIHHALNIIYKKNNKPIKTFIIASTKKTK